MLFVFFCLYLNLKKLRIIPKTAKMLKLNYL